MSSYYSELQPLSKPCILAHGTCITHELWSQKISISRYPVITSLLFFPLFLGDSNKNHLYCRWINAAKFLTGASTVGSLAIPIILRHAHMIETSAMWIEFVSFFIFVCTVMCFHRASLEDEWWWLKNIQVFTLAGNNCGQKRSSLTTARSVICMKRESNRTNPFVNLFMYMFKGILTTFMVR